MANSYHSKRFGIAHRASPPCKQHTRKGADSSWRSRAAHFFGVRADSSIALVMHGQVVRSTCGHCHLWRCGAAYGQVERSSLLRSVRGLSISDCYGPKQQTSVLLDLHPPPDNCLKNKQPRPVPTSSYCCLYDYESNVARSKKPAASYNSTTVAHIFLFE